MTRSRIRFSIALLFALLVAGGGGWSAQVARRQATELAALAQRTAHQRSELQRLRAEREAARRAAAMPNEPPPAAALDFATGDAAFDGKIQKTLARLAQLRVWLQSHPGENIPEFQFLRDVDWIEAATPEDGILAAVARKARLRQGIVLEEAPGEAAFDLRSVARDLRASAKFNLATLLEGALRSYAEAHGGRLPTDLGEELKPFLVFPIPDAVLRRYEMRATGPLAAVPRDLPIVGERAEAIVATDRPFVLFPTRSSGMEIFQQSPFLYAPGSSPERAVAVSKANQAYRNAHGGAYPPDLAALVPYFENSALAADLVDDQAARDLLSRAITQGNQDYTAAHGGRNVEPKNRADILPYVRDPAARAILAAKDSYLAAQGKHSEKSSDLRPYVTDPAARTLLEKLIRAEAASGTR